MVCVVACLMVGHWVTLPHPEIGQQLTPAVMGDDSGTQNPEWTAFHFLYGECPCLRRILKHVVNRTPVSGVCERIVLIGEDAEFQRKAADNGFEVDCITATQLKEKYNVEAAPLLMVVNEYGTIAYAGGYTSRKQGLDVQDELLIRQCMAGENADGLPLYGCAVSKNLKSIVDPLGFK